MTNHRRKNTGDFWSYGTEMGQNQITNKKYHLLPAIICLLVCKLWVQIPHRPPLFSSFLPR